MAEEKKIEDITQEVEPKNSKEGTAPVTEVLDNMEIPEDLKKVMEVGFSMQRFSGPMPSPLLGKITEGHITTILEQSEKEDKRAFDHAKSGRNYTLTYTILFIALFVFLTIYLVTTDVELYKETLKIIVVFAGGFGSGYGLKSYFNRKNE